MQTTTRPERPAAPAPVIPISRRTTSARAVDRFELGRRWLVIAMGSILVAGLGSAAMLSGLMWWASSNGGP